MSDRVDSIVIRRANSEEMSFVVQAILEAEAGGLGPIPWCALFELTQAEFKKIIVQILEEELEGQEWCLPQFFIAYYQGQPVAALSAWTEQSGGQSSAMLMSSLVYHFIPAEKRESAEDRLNKFSQLRISRTPGTLQLESIYTHPDYRGKGIMRQLITEVIHQEKRANPELAQVEIILSGSNLAARAAYEKAGFDCVEVVKYSGAESEILSLFPGTSRIKMSKSLSI